MVRTIVVAAMLVAGCTSRNPQICSSDMPDRVAYVVPRSTLQVQENVKGCVSHWAARLSFGEDSAETTARAALAACRDGFSDMQQQASFENKTLDFDRFTDEMFEIALFRVVQNRAGNCGIPEVGELPPLDKSENHLIIERDAKQQILNSYE